MDIEPIKKHIEIPFLQSITSPIDALTARGFLFESLGDNQYKYYFDKDHSRYYEGDRTDYNDLDEICSSTGVGCFVFQTGIITIENDNVNLIPLLFTEDRRAFPVCERDQGFEYYLTHPDSFNPVGVIELEPFVARYVKVLHTCGIPTDFSCDGYGFHNVRFGRDGKGHIVIKATGLLWKRWHKWIVENYLSDEVNLPWNDDYTEIIFERGRLAEVYEKLQQASNLMFKYKEEIKSIFDESAFSEELDFLDDIAAVKQMMIIASEIKANKGL